MTRLKPVDPRLLRAAPALRRHLLLLAPVLVARAAATVAGAVLLARAIAAVWEGGTPTSVLLQLVAVVAVRAGLDALTDWLGTGARDRARQQLRTATLGAVAAAGPSWLAQQDRQRLAHTVGPGLDALDGYVLRVLPALVSAAVVPPLLLVVMLRTDVLSTVLLAATLPLVPLFLALVGLRTRDRTARSYATLAQLSARVVDLLEGLPGLKVLGRAQGQLAAVARVTERYRAQALATLRWAFLSGLVLDLLATLSVALVAVSAGLRLQAGHLGLTAALTVLLLAPEVYLPLRAVGTQFHASADALEAAAAALDVLAAPPAPATLQQAATPVAELVGVTVVHPGRTAPALRDLTLSLRPGEVVAVEGPSGAGKSTLLALLLGSLAPTSGRIGYGESWRSRLAWCPQRPRCSSPTVAEELRLGDPGATDEQVVAALARCEAPGPQVLLGEDGSAVSAGQRRRVALARVLLRARAVAARGQTALVLLDEPSEDLDGHGEAVVARVIEDLRGLATVVVVTHSPELAAVADRRLRLDDGALVHDARPARALVADAPLPDDPGPAGPVQPAAAAAQAGAREVLRLLRADAAGLGGRTAVALLLGVAAAVSGLALTGLSGWLLLRAAQHPELQVLSLAVVGVRFTALSKALLRYGERLAAHDVALRLLARTRVRVVAALVPLAPEGLGLWRRGDVLRRFSADVDAVQDTVVRGLLPLAGAAASGLTAVAVVAALAPAAALPLALLLALTALVGPLAARAGRRGAEHGAALAGTRDEAVVGWLESLPELWVLDQHEQRAAQVVRLEAAGATVTRPVRRCAAASAGATSLLAGLAPALVLAVAPGGGLLAGVAALLAVAAVEPVAALGPVWAALAGAVRRAGRVTDLLHVPAPVPEPAVPTAPPPGPVTLHVQDAALAHPGCPPVLRDVDVRVRPGERVALVGRSGSGKSTVVAAALRLLDPVAGAVTLAGADELAVPLRELRAADLPPLVAGCLQDDHLFATTLRENLRVGRPAATDADLDEVAARLGLLGWVRGLPDGWDTQVGADGALVSGGQRQRLLVARALLADPDVLVLDEPTAHLDPETERLVMADVLRATRGRTLLLSTHRRTGLDELDDVWRVEAGTVRTRALAR